MTRELMHNKAPQRTGGTAASQCTACAVLKTDGFGPSDAEINSNEQLLADNRRGKGGRQPTGKRHMRRADHVYAVVERRDVSLDDGEL